MDRKTFAYFISPSVILMVLLMVVPLMVSIWLSMHTITLTTIDSPTFVGFDNYAELLGLTEGNTSRFWSSMNFTLVYIVVTVPIQITLGLVVALMLDQIRAFRGVYVAATLLPFIVTPIVGALMFRTPLQDGEIIQWLLDEYLNIDINFFLRQNVPYVIFAHAIWYVTPFAIITLFAGLQTIPQEPLEAARVDGANWFERLWYVVLPNMRSLFILLALINMMDAYRVFDSIYVLAGENSGVETLMYYNFDIINSGRLGQANAMSTLTVIGVMVILIPWLYLTYRQQMEDR